MLSDVVKESLIMNLEKHPTILELKHTILEHAKDGYTQLSVPVSNLKDLHLLQEYAKVHGFVSELNFYVDEDDEDDEGCYRLTMSLA